jgi:hypothetical protein
MKNIDALQNGVWLWPFTAECAFLVHMLKANGVIIHGIYDNKESLWGETYSGIPIEKPTDDAEQTVIVCGYRHYDKARRYFSGALLHLNDVLASADIKAYKNEILIDTIRRLAPRQLAKAKAIETELKHEFIGKDFDEHTTVLNAVIVRLTSRCNLRCDKCCALCHYYTNAEDTELQSLCDDFDTIMSKSDYLRRVSVVGGEPLLYAHLREYLKHIVRYKERIGHMHIVTNGTILADDAILNLMSDNDIGLWISDYGKISKNADKLENAARAAGVFVRRHYDITWTDLLHPHEKDGGGQKRFDRCWARTVCPYIHKGKGFPCAFAVASYELKMVPYSKENFIDLKPASREELERFYLCREKAHDCCSYCSGCDSAMEDIPAAVQLKKPLPLPFDFPDTYPAE